jgi:hypothetical protein
MRRERLSGPQISALECCGLEHPDDDAERLLARCWAAGDRRALVFDPGEAEALWAALRDLSNAEDDFAEDRSQDREMRRLAGRAARSLGAIGSRVLICCKTGRS